MTDVLPADGLTESALLALAAALEQRSEHPLARAVMLRAEEDKLSVSEVSDFRALPGNGLTATLNDEELLGGSLSFISTKADVPQALRDKAEALAEEGKTPLLFARGGKLAGVIAVADVIKEDSPAAIAALRNMGIHVVMLTGDNEKTARAIGRQAGVDEVIAGVLPEGKESVIRSLQKQGKVAMVGDGINDAPALAYADVGISLGSKSTDIAMETSDVVISRDDPMMIPELRRLSRATMHIVQQNFAIVIGINTVGLILGAASGISVMLSALMRNASTILVVANSLRLMFFPPMEGR